MVSTASENEIGCMLSPRDSIVQGAAGSGFSDAGGVSQKKASKMHLLFTSLKRHSRNVRGQWNKKLSTLPSHCEHPHVIRSLDSARVDLGAGHSKEEANSGPALLQVAH